MPSGITQCYLSPSSSDFPAFTPAEATKQYHNRDSNRRYESRESGINRYTTEPPLSACTHFSHKQIKMNSILTVVNVISLQVVNNKSEFVCKIKIMQNYVAHTRTMLINNSSKSTHNEKPQLDI